MMTTGDHHRTILPMHQNMDTFSFGSLNEALDELNFLNTEVTVPTPKDEFNLNGLRTRGTRFASNSLYQRRHTSQPPQLDVSTSSAYTKENLAAAIAFPYEFESELVLGRTSSKSPQLKAHRVRTCPYYRRKPLYSLAGRSGDYRDVSNRINGCTITNSDYYLRSLRSVNSLPKLCEAEGKGRVQLEPIDFHPSSFLIDDGRNRKTEDCRSYSFPLPLLTRSKSLEDLRESAKPKLKSLSSDMASGNSMCSFDASLSPRRTIFGRNGTQNTTFPMMCPRRLFENGFHPRVITSKEIDSMSILIGKLDVA